MTFHGLRTHCDDDDNDDDSEDGNDDDDDVDKHRKNCETALECLN